MDLAKLFRDNANLHDIESRSSLERKSKFLSALLYGWGILHLLAFFGMIYPPWPGWPSFAIIGLSFSFSVGLFFVNRQGYTQLAATLFCIIANIILILAFLSGIVNGDPLVNVAVQGSLLSVGILFAGMLISARAIIWFALANVALIFAPFYFASDSLSDWLSWAFPIIAFLVLVAIVSWLYQRTLDQAISRLMEARVAATQSQILQRDVEIARDLQQKLYPLPPEISECIHIAARSESARETSGDFYDFIPLEEGRIALVVADVSGKSLPAALIMTMVRSIVRHEARLNDSPASVLNHVNQTAIEDAAIDQIITMFYGILDPHQLILRFANAGHPYPIIKRNGELITLEAPGLPIKAIHDATYENHTIQLVPGDQIVWVSDGIIEAHNSDKELFGFTRLEESIQRSDCSTPTDMLDYIWQDVAQHQGRAEQADDITLVVATIDPEMQLSSGDDTPPIVVSQQS